MLVYKITKELADPEFSGEVFVSDIEHILSWFPLMGHYVSCYDVPDEAISRFAEPVRAYEMMATISKPLWCKKMTLSLLRSLMKQGANLHVKGELGMTGYEVALMRRDLEGWEVYAKHFRKEREIEPVLDGYFGKIGDKALKKYSTVGDGIHGAQHRANVLKNGMDLIFRMVADVNPRMVEMFALFHDIARLSDDQDPKHGWRGGDLARAMCEKILSKEERDVLFETCRDHSNGRTRGSLVMQICWDADRLDLGRAGIKPDPRLMCTEEGKKMAEALA